MRVIDLVLCDNPPFTDGHVNCIPEPDIFFADCDVNAEFYSISSALLYEFFFSKFYVFQELLKKILETRTFLTHLLISDFRDSDNFIT